jgi:hypothetical protein
VTQGWSIDVWALSVMGRQNRAGTGSASVTVQGASMGLVTYTGRAREGHTGCEATEWESETSVRCLVTHGARGTRGVSMTVGERGMSVTQSCSFDPARISKVFFNISSIKPNATTFLIDHFDDGLEHFDFFTTNFSLSTITLIGHGFGSDDFSPRGSMGQSAVDASDWVSDSSVACKFSEQSISATRVTAVTSGSQVLETCSSICLNLPTLTLIRFCAGCVIFRIFFV